MKRIPPPLSRIERIAIGINLVLLAIMVGLLLYVIVQYWRG